RQSVEESAEDSSEVVFASVLRARRSEAETFAAFLAQAHVAGVGIDWEAFYTGTGARRIPLPTYAFQRERYWLAPSTGGGDAVAAGLGRLDHPMLAAAVALGDRDEWLLTGRVSTDTQPWTAEHVLLGNIVVPGTALVELVLAAGRHTATPVIEELILESPFLLEEGNAVQVQVTVGEPDEDGRRAVAVYTRPEVASEADAEGGGGAAEATCHARGVLALEAEPAEAWPVEWPPEGAEPLAVEEFYSRLSDIGYDYGPVFQGLRAAWRDGDEVYAEVSLTDEHRDTARAFGIHPALFDAALQSGAVLLIDGDGGERRMPFSWSGVRLSGRGASRLRVRVVSVGGSALRLDAVDDAGAEIVSVRSIVARPVALEQLEGAQRAGSSSLYKVDWIPVTETAPADARIAVLGGPGHADLDALVAGLADGAEAPDLVLAEVGGQGEQEDSPASVPVRTLGLLQDWLAREQLADARLVVVTRGAVAIGDESPDLMQAPVWGLVRSAQSENPGRIMLIDVAGEGEVPDWGALAALEEPQVAVRGGRVLVPRLQRAAAATAAAPALDPDGAVLITGGTGGLGALFARHLAEQHGARHLVLLSRRGPDAPGVADLVGELAVLGCEARAVACDVSDREELAALIASLERPLTAVIHAAGVLDDGVVTSLTPEQLARVMGPKADAA
ncbi:type I polyketide synthase, partial [Streptomyces sp. NPDC050529]|uniref:type I polyketide synthase n=1 Tax=Streptomyces sp. NPDC050529 TaxID=3365624 RepID=UPI0037B22A2D